jgi:hypothetical protein
MSEMPFGENTDPSPTVIWFPSLAQSPSEEDGGRKNDERRTRTRGAQHPTRTDRSRRAEDERARLIRLIG